MTPDELILRGDAANRILKDETAMRALGDIERECFENWARTNPNDTETREFQYRQMRAIELFQSKLESYAQLGAHEKGKAEQRIRDAQDL